MMKQEFEQAMGFAVAPETFDRIEEVYMNCEFFNSKEQLYSFYKQYDMNGIERLYKDVLVKKRQLQQIINLQAENYELSKEFEEFKKSKLQETEELKKAKMQLETIITIARKRV